MAVQARERLLATAEELFYREGLRAVGIDRVLAESGVGKASLYRHFAGKEELAAEVLRRCDAEWRAWLAGAVERLADAPDQRPLAVFDALAERFARRDFRGCAFINTMVEAADAGTELHAVAAQHKEHVIDYVEGLLTDAGVSDARTVAEQLQLVIDGAIVTAVREQSPAAAGRGRQVAAAILAAADTPPRRRAGVRAGRR